jgi:anti-sigma regulatory factor (Ser/Thr protein kinase)
MRTPARDVTQAYAARPESIAAAREAMAELARRCGADEEQVDRVRLAISEAVTNAIRHGYRDGDGDVWVMAQFEAGALSVVVCDEGVGMRPHATGTGLGLGLGIVARVSDQMAIVPRAQGGTELHMRFDLVDAAGSVRVGGGVERGDRAGLADGVVAAE